MLQIMRKRRNFVRRQSVSLFNLFIFVRLSNNDSFLDVLKDLKPTSYLKYHVAYILDSSIACTFITVLLII